MAEVVTFDCYRTLIDFDLEGATAAILGGRLQAVEGSLRLRLEGDRAAALGNRPRGPGVRLRHHPDPRPWHAPDLGQPLRAPRQRSLHALRGDPRPQPAARPPRDLHLRFVGEGRAPPATQSDARLAPTCHVVREGRAPPPTAGEAR